MRIICNRPSGFGLPGLRIRPGENLVDDDLWTSVRIKLNPKWLAALLAPKPDGPPDLVVLLDSDFEYETEPAPMSAKEKIALVEQCGDLDELGQLEAGEHRKTVLHAISKRLDVLTEVNALEMAEPEPVR